MNEELLNSLIAALNLSPDNHLLRKQVIQGMLELQRWEDIKDYAQPLLKTDLRAFALIALAKSALAYEDIESASGLYEEATGLDPNLVDEQFEAALQPKLRLPMEGLQGSDRMDFQPYNGPNVTFGDVGGMDALKEQIRLNIIYPFQQPDLFAAYGKKIGGGIMMYGPPGCGKTHIARATAGELDANFYILELSDVLSMWVGETEKNLRALFEVARANSPSVIFIDEIDAIGAKRSDITSSTIRWFVTQLLTEMDGIASNNDKLLVLGATNVPWDVDSAFRRPGRFDRLIFVPPPDAKAREEIFKLYSRGRKIDPGLCWADIAEKTELYSGADIAALTDRACESALTEALKYGRMRDVVLNDFIRTAKSMHPSTVDWLRRAKNYVTYANQDGFYNDLAAYISKIKL